MRHSGPDREASFQDQDDAGQKVALIYGYSGPINRQLADCGLGGRDLLRKSCAAAEDRARTTNVPRRRGLLNGTSCGRCLPVRRLANQVGARPTSRRTRALPGV